jgi:hypothetical protein
MNMNKMNLVMSTMSLLILATPALAAKKVLPADATNVKIASTSIAQVVTGQTLITDGLDGPVYENNYSPALEVTVTYDSQDASDDATALDNSNNNPQEVVVGGPTLTFDFAVTASQVASIQAGTLDAKTLVSMSVAQTTVQFKDQEFTSSCRFDNENSAPLNPECIQTITSTEVRPVLSISLN